MAHLALIVQVAQLQGISFLVEIDKGVRVDLLQFGRSGVAHVHLIAAREQRPLGVSVEPGGQRVGRDFELSSLYIDMSRRGGLLLYALETGSFKRSFYASAVFQFGGCLVEHLSCRLCQSGHAHGESRKNGKEYMLDFNKNTF